MYCTKEDVQYALAPSGNTQGTAWAATDEAYADAIIEAQGTIDAHVKGRYNIIETELITDPPTVPVVTVAPAPVRQWTRDVAAYLLTLTYKRNVDMSENDPIRLRYQHVMSQLADVRSGVLDLPLPSATNGSDGLVVEEAYVGRLFTADDFLLGPVPNGMNGPFNEPRYGHF